MDGRKSTRVYFNLVDAKANHKLRCAFPKQKELEKAEANLREWASPSCKPVSDLVCITGEVASSYTEPHSACPVVADGKVCPCECRTCKRAWFADGRPILSDGEIVREDD